MELHEAASGLFFVSATVHMISSLRTVRRNPFTALTGLISFAVSIILIAACHITKDTRKKMLWHRIYSLFLALSVAAHTVGAALAKEN